MRVSAVALVLACALCAAARAASWPAYRGGAGRGGYTAEQPPAKLSLRWTYQPAHPPAPAWPSEPRMPFDRAYHVVADGERVYFGSSADCKVYALDAATGRERWTFFTGGPVRFAPVLWKDRLFAASDDGWLYCLSAKDGKLVWKRRGAPSGRMVLGNGRMISKWPVRGGPVVAGDVVYFGAGIWTSDGIYLSALKAASGEPVWINDSAGAMELDQPHMGARARSGVSPQGYLAVGKKTLLVPTGRALPAAFDRADGKFRYFHLQKYGGSGGTPTLFDGLFFSGGVVFDVASGTRRVREVEALAVSPQTVYRYQKGTLFAVPRARPVLEKEVAGRRGKRKVYTWGQNWKARCGKGAAELIVAGKTVFLGWPGRVTAFDTMAKKETWSTKVDGLALGLAFSAGRLYVSTDRGAIHCFAAPGGAPGMIKAKPDPAPYGANAAAARAAEEIIRKTGLKEGYCLDLGCGYGGLAFELAKRTKLHIYGVEKDPAKVGLARKRLAAAGLYGVRVTVLEADPAKTELPNYFADLVVSANSVTGGAVPQKEAMRCLRPYGGMLCLGKAGGMKKTVRGPLAGAGEWTHQYADPANTACSGDPVKGPLTVLWFGGPDQTMANRHGRAPAPLFAGGRLYVQGLNGIRAVSAYNGRVLWDFPIKDITKPYHGEHLVGTAATGSNICTDGKVLYVRTGDRCLRIDGVTGRKLSELKAPPRPDGKAGTWGYVAVAGGTLFGSLANEKHIVKWRFGRGGPEQRDMSRQFSESVSLFALDAVSGKLKWTYAAKKSIRHNAIAVGKGRVFLIDRPVAAMDRVDVAKGAKGPAQPPGVLLALDAATGREKWKVEKGIFGTMLALSEKHDVLLMAYQPTRFKQPSETGGRMAALRASSGKLLWDVKAKYSTRPIINGRTLYPSGYDLLTGKRKQNWRFKRSYGCGILSGGRNILLFRSATLGYRDLTGKEGTRNYGPARPGCWINAIPAGGLVLVPDYTDKCSCSYLIKTSLALERRE